VIKDYISLVKFSHTVFALPFAIIGYFLALHTEQVDFSWLLFLLVIGCMVFGRNAAMAFNRWADEAYDKANPRTANREIPAGKVKRNSALMFIGLNCLLFVITTYFINPLCFYLSPIVLAVLLGYSYTKRFTPYSHMVLGFGLAIAPIGAYLAVHPELKLIPILLGAVVLTWVSGFDIIYSLQDDSFDKANNLFSIPSVFGRKNALFISILLHVVSAALLLFIGWKGAFGIGYWIGAIVFIALLTYQHFLVKPNDLSKVNLAFFTTNGVASIVFGLLVVLDLFIF